MISRNILWFTCFLFQVSYTMNGPWQLLLGKLFVDMSTYNLSFAKFQTTQRATAHLRNSLHHCYTAVFPSKCTRTHTMVSTHCRSFCSKLKPLSLGRNNLRAAVYDYSETASSRELMASEKSDSRRPVIFFNILSVTATRQTAALYELWKTIWHFVSFANKSPFRAIFQIARRGFPGRQSL